MKKPNNKLKLNKETVSTLNDEQMKNVKGGFTYILSGGQRCRSVKDYASCCCGGKDPRG